MAGLVVMHVSDDPADVSRGLAAARLVASREPMRVRLIVNGRAVTGLLAANVDAGRVDPGEGVQVFACQRALAGQNIAPGLLAENVGTVPSAVIELATAQHDGAAYIRI